MSLSRDGSFHDGVYQKPDEPAEYMEDNGWMEDHWDGIDESKATEEGVQDPRFQAKLVSDSRWDSFLAFGRRIFGQDAGQTPALGQALFGGDSSKASSQASALVPLLRGVDQNHEKATGSGEPLDKLESGESFGSEPSADAPNNIVQDLTDGDSFRALTRRGHRRGSRPWEDWRNWEWQGLGTGFSVPNIGLRERLDPVFGWVQKGLGSREGEQQRIGGSRERISWKHKAMEVLPVLGVVALAVLGTFIYLVLVDGVWPEERAEFSLSCEVGRGKWVRSSERSLYSSSCPYIRDAWNCHKFGLNSAHDMWRWEPDTCVVPQFDPHEFLRVMQGKRVAFVGDQSAANAFDSLVCMLAEAEEPRLSGGAVDVSPEAEGKADESSRQSPEPQESSADGQPGPEHQLSPQEASHSWRPLSGWGFSWKHHPSQADIPSQRHHVLQDRAWASRKMEYTFLAHNFTLLLYDSPLLVQAAVDVAVNDTACQLSKAASSSPTVEPSLADVEEGESSDPSSQHSETTSSQARPEQGPKEGIPPLNQLDTCYPNRILIDRPDPLWASEAQQLDVLVLNSGRGWREEEVEMQGLGIYEGGVRQSGMSVEGLVGRWAYPRAMAEIARWLGNATHFRGNAIFRSYSPSHQRRECAGRMMLTEETVLAAVNGNDHDRYDRAVVEALQHTPVRFLNISLLSSERGDGHPWMSSPMRPKPDCTSWCLPGIPDSWNEMLAATLMTMYEEEHPLKPVIPKKGVNPE